MKVAGIIVEYNPFHNGHQYHIEETKRLTGADYVIAVMSGDFTQRGIPACFDKFTRTECALLGGADVVLELPFCYATASAEIFAEGAVTILDQLGLVDFLCFGTEGPADASLYHEVAAFLCEEPENYRTALKEGLRNGLSYPQARAAASEGLLRAEAHALLSSPNALLGIEYCKALYRRKSAIKVVPIPRIGSGYHEQTTDAAGFSSATAIRSLLFTKTNSNCSGYSERFYKELGDTDYPDGFLNELPPASAEFLKGRPNLAISPEDFLPLLSYALQTNADRLTDYYDVSEELAARIRKVNLAQSYEELVLSIKSKQYTRTRIERCLLHILLQLSTKDLDVFRTEQVSYARILGFKKEATALLHALRDTAREPVLTKLAQRDKRLNESELRLLSYDITAAELYNRVVFYKYGVLLPQEHTYILTNR